MYSAICPGCGLLLITNVHGQVWMGCQSCQWYGQLITTSLPPSLQGAAAPHKPLPASSSPAPTSSTAPSSTAPAQPTQTAQATLQCPNCSGWTAPATARAKAQRLAGALGSFGYWGVCPLCGFNWPLPPAMPQPPSAPASPPAFSSSSALVTLTPPTAPAPTTQPAQQRQHVRQVGALDLDTFAEEVYQALRAMSLSAFEATLPASWDRLQTALDTLHATLGGRHMGDYPPSGEPVAEAVLGVTTRALLLLWAVGRLHERADETNREVRA